MSHPAVTVYSKSECRACDRTKTELEIRGAVYTEVNIEEDAVAYEYVTKTLGHQQAPVVVVDTETGLDHWSGLNPGKIKELKKTIARVKTIINEKNKEN